MRTLILNKFLHRNGGSQRRIYSNWVRHWSSTDTRFSTSVWSTKAAAWATGSMLIHLIWTSTAEASCRKLTYPIKTIYSKEARVQLRKVLDDFKPDVCHLNNFNYQLTPSIILEIVKWRKETGRDCKIIFTAHDYQLVCPNHQC